MALSDLFPWGKNPPEPVRDRIPPGQVLTAPRQRVACDMRMVVSRDAGPHDNRTPPRGTVGYVTSGAVSVTRGGATGCRGDGYAVPLAPSSW